MADVLTRADAQWGIAIETTVGTAVDAAIGLPNLDMAAIVPGQEWIEDRKSNTGQPMLTTSEVVSDVVNPLWSPQLSLFHTEAAGTDFSFGALVAMLTQNVSEAGTGPYTQTMEPDSDAKEVAFGETVDTECVTATIYQRLGQSTSRDIYIDGVVCNRIDVTIPESGRVTVTPSFQAIGFDLDADGSGGTYTLPTTTTEQLARDFVFKLGDGTPAALYSKEVSFSLIADVVAKRYGGFNNRFPYKFVFRDWSLEGSISKPILSGTNMQLEDFIYAKDSGFDQLFYVYSQSMSDYNEAAASRAHGEYLFTFNIKFDEPTVNFDDETVEQLSFKGVHDGTNNIFKVEQTTDTAQPWAS